MKTLLIGGIEVTDSEYLALKDGLVDPEQWLRDAFKGKIAHCQKQMDLTWRPLLDADPSVVSIPANLSSRIAIITARKDYKDRATRDAEAKG